MKRRVCFLFVSVAWIATTLPAQPPIAISPGSSTVPSVLVGSCPTFHWTAAPDAESITLVIYRLSRESVQPADPVVRLDLPGTAQGWTPALHECLVPGESYAWSLGVHGEWSEAALFDIAVAPSEVEVERALDVLRRYSATREKLEAENPPRQTAAGESEGATAPRRSTSTPRARDIRPLLSTTTGPTEPPLQTVTPPAGYSLSLDGALRMDGYVFREGFPLLHTDGGDQYGNTALGLNALVSSQPGYPDFYSGRNNTALGWNTLRYNTYGGFNTGLGSAALIVNTTGEFNTAAGANSLRLNSSGGRNSALGYGALSSNSTGNDNTAVGADSLRSNTSFSNTAVGSDALRSSSSGNENTAVGTGALTSSSIGSRNVAIGVDALRDSTEASENTAIGVDALANNTTGIRNTAVGFQAIDQNEFGSQNTAVGWEAMDYRFDIGNGNTAVGTQALGGAFLYSSLGSFNTALGAYALHSSVGTSNIALGAYAGSDLGGGSNNIFIGNSGASGDGTTNSNDVIRIGSGQDLTFVDGIFGATASGGVQVFVNSSDQLGTATSSRRFKEKVAAMGEASEALLSLRPVTFRYTPDAAGTGARPLEFGLIAEEVAEIFPDLVVRDERGQPYSVRYHVLPAMLLNELQKQHRRDVLQGWLIAALMATACIRILASRRGRGLA